MVATGPDGQSADKYGADGQLIDTLLASLPRSFWKEGAEPITGGLLLAVLKARIDDVQVVGSLRDQIAAYFKVGDDLISDVIEFADGLVASCDPSPSFAPRTHEAQQSSSQAAPDQRRVVLCRGLSCMLNGAKRWHAAYSEILQSSGLRCNEEQVFCLSQCELGPSVMNGKTIWVGRGQQVIDDERDWRDDESGSGPIAINSHTPPVRD